MGTKLQYAINPFAAASNNLFAVNQVGDRGYSRETRARGHLERSILHHFKYSMGEMFDLQNIEAIKTTMLMHEDIFQRQVRELHRLYDRQMKLMYELKNEITRTCDPFSVKAANNSQFASWHKQMQDIRSNLPVDGLTCDLGERSASCSGESLRMPKGFNLEKVAEEGPSTSIHPIEQDEKGTNSYRVSRHNKASMDGTDEEIDVELTLSIGCSNKKRRSNSQMKPCSLELGGSDSNFNRIEICSSALIKRNTREDFGEPSPTLSSSSATLNQDHARSNWLFQDLSLKRTSDFNFNNS